MGVAVVSAAVAADRDCGVGLGDFEGAVGTAFVIRIADRSNDCEVARVRRSSRRAVVGERDVEACRVGGCAGRFGRAVVGVAEVSQVIVANFFPITSVPDALP